MANRTITFTLQGNDQLSAALKNAEKNLRGLTGATFSANTRALANAQANLKNIEQYKKLQAAILANNAAQIQSRADQAKLFKQRQEAVKQLGDMQKAYARLQDVYKANRRAMGTEAANVMKGQLRDAANELKAQQRVVQNLDRAYDALPNHARKLQEQLASQRTQLAQLRTSIPTANIAAAEAALRSQIEQTTNALNREIAALERRNQIHQNFSQAGQDLSNAYSNFQGAVQTAQTLMNPFTQAADNAMTFEKAMSRLKSLTQMKNLRAGNLAQVEAEMRSMTSTIANLGATTEYTANQIAGAANFYAMSGWTSEQINAMLPTTTDLASISLVSIDRVADMLSDDMTAFGIKAGQSYKLASGRVVDGAKYFGDAVAYATTQANMDLTTFHESWKYNAPTAHAMNLSLGESIAQNMVAANAGIKGSMSGTSFRQFWVRLAAPPKSAQKSLEEMGLAASDATKKVMETQAAMNEAGVDMNSDLFTKIEALERYYQTLSGDARTGWLKALTGQTALSGVQSLFDLGKLDEARRYKQDIDSGAIGGWAADTARVMRDNTLTEIEYAKSALDALQRSAGDALLPTIRSAAESITPLIASLAEFTAQHPQVVQGFATIAASISAATVSIAAFSLAMAGVRFAQAGIATAGLVFGDLAAKVSMARTALLGLSAANVTASLSTGLTAATTAMRAFGSAALMAARSAMMFMFTPLGAALLAIGAAAYYAYNHWDQLSAAFSTIGDALSSSMLPALESAGQAVNALLGTALAPVGDVISNLTNYIGGGLVGALVGALGIVGSLFSGIVVGVAGVIKTIAELGSGIADAFGKLKDGDFSGAFDALSDAAARAADNYKSAWLDSFSAVQSGIEGTAAAIDNLAHPQTLPTAADTFSAGLSAMPDSWDVQPLADASNQAATSLTNVQMPADQVAMSFTNLPPSVDAVTTSTQAVTPALDQLTGALPGPIDGLNALGPAASSAASALQSAAAQISSIKISVPQVNYVPMNVPIAHNAAGGIYDQGEFMTTFAEDSPEAAIPIDSSARSRSLWMQTGQLLGMNSAEPINLSLTINIAGKADKQTIVDGVNEVMPRLESFAEQLRSHQHEQRRRSFA